MLGKKLFAIRGAVCCENTENSILENVLKMCNELFELNKIKSRNLVSIQFTMTSDLNAINAATALRRGKTAVDTSSVALFVSQEAQIQNMLPKTIRVMILAYLPKNTKIRNVYLNGAQKLRPDMKFEQ